MYIHIHIDILFTYDYINIYLLCLGCEKRPDTRRFVVRDQSACSVGAAAHVRSRHLFHNRTLLFFSCAIELN